MIKFFFKIIVIAILLFVLIEVLPYFFAIYKFEQLTEVKLLTKDKVEKILLLSSHKQIPIKESMWGKHTELKNNESCWQYLVLWKEPIDIVYDENNNVTHLFESYE